MSPRKVPADCAALRAKARARLESCVAEALSLQRQLANLLTIIEGDALLINNLPDNAPPCGALEPAAQNNGAKILHFLKE